MTLAAVLFGKLPMAGDYLRVGSDHQLLDCLDAWLTRAWFAFASGTDDWEEAFRVAPLWRFSAPVLGSDSLCVGVLSPSLDSVGRLFPVVVCRRVHCDSVLDALANSADWLDCVENSILHWLSLGGTDFEVRDLLSGLGDVSLEDPSTGPVLQFGLAGLQKVAVLHSDSGWVSGIPSRPGTLGSNWSVWQASDQDGRSERLLWVGGLPGPSALNHLLAGGPLDVAASPGAQRYAAGSYRLDALKEVPLLSEPASLTPVGSEPWIFRGPRGVAVVLGGADQSGEPQAAVTTLLDDLLSLSAPDAVSFAVASGRFRNLVESMVVFGECDQGWAVVILGDRFSTCRDALWGSERPELLSTRALGASHAVVLLPDLGTGMHVVEHRSPQGEASVWGRVLRSSKSSAGLRSIVLISPA